MSMTVIIVFGVYNKVLLKQKSLRNKSNLKAEA